MLSVFLVQFQPCQSCVFCLTGSRVKLAETVVVPNFIKRQYGEVCLQAFLKVKPAVYYAPGVSDLEWGAVEPVAQFLLVEPFELDQLGPISRLNVVFQNPR